MTKALVQAQINHGNAMIVVGDLDSAAQSLSQAQVSLSQYSRALAAERRSQSSAKTLAKTLAKTVSKLRKALIARDGEALQTPTYSTARSVYGREGLVQPTYAAPTVRTQGNDALIQPSFHGALGNAPLGLDGGVMPALGFALATLGLVIGIGTLYKSW